jgi:2-iminobutanoate/2-iminopropanoate deaminase
MLTLINDVPQVPLAVGPYSQAVKANGLLFASGQIPINPTAGKIEATDIAGQTEQVLANIRALLTGNDLVMTDVIKCTVFLRDMADFPQVNKIYEAAFAGHKPARSTVAVAGLPLNALIEIEVTALLR